LSVLATDANGVIQLFSVGAERMLGYSAVEVINRLTAIDIHDPQALMARARAVSRELSTTIAPDWDALTRKGSLGLEDCYESVLIHKNLDRMPVVIETAVLCDDIGGIIGYLLIVTDMTGRNDVACRLSKGPPPAVRRNVSKADLLTLMSHEMRTPLSAILGFAQLMESARPSPTESQKRSIDRILKAGWHLEKLIIMTRDLASLDAGTLSLSLEAVPLAVVMLECQAIIESQANLRGIRVIFPRCDQSYCVSADRVRLKEVLGYLLSAAIEYTEADGTIVMDVDTHNADWVRIVINDGGEGRFAERLTRHFRACEDMEPEVTAVDGTGIGLLLAKHLVELMGGAIGSISADRTRTSLSFDLKRVVVPIGSDRTLTHASFGKTAIPSGGQPQGSPSKFPTWGVERNVKG
jgi:signal transduction histidine kinase